MISADMRQFRLRHLLMAMIWVSVAMASLTSGRPSLIGLGVGMLGVGGAIGLMFLSDVVDPRHWEERNVLSNSINFVGVLLLFGSAFVGLVSWTFYCCFILVGLPG
jgi:hypothetical protein